MPSQRRRFHRLAPTGALILGLVALPALANPGNGGGPPEHAKGGQGGQGGQGSQGPSERLHRDATDRDRERHEERRFDDRDWDRDRDRYGRDGPSLEEALIRDIFYGHRDRYAREDRASIPPGVRQNLARGKPMPPGIGKRFDDDIRRDLPHYDGYEWRRVGVDAVLVDITNDIIYDVIRDVLD
ncbi:MULTISPECIES: anti-virulence regulator CigR family protein [Halomonas]|uniref:Nickel/cobalt transporter regulator n=1 Tax=Halomonas halophila TaxID=29573 RepID=A0ABQ0U4F1_9GAMM|nr:MULTISPECIES: anti-virulence regulator CigR family protein [Halomonas]MDR5888250.1 anti-virulence regulator CigR family protein [Halomonas salina]RAH36778.1 hypothetical protein C9J49_014600 [Halomonas sp. SL1]WJY08766.1 anti-virulence regulator CigR family protein [Halomonas halophila]GEK71884.1 hypothetical protein HHA04nite_04280 [Halomonas halophila]